MLTISFAVSSLLISYLSGFNSLVGFEILYSLLNGIKDKSHMELFRFNGYARGEIKFIILCIILIKVEHLKINIYIDLFK